MALVNRDKDVSEQKDVWSASVNLAATGVTLNVGPAIPYPCQIKNAVAQVSGISGTPVLTLGVYRFIAGSGATAFTGVASALTIGVSGVVTFASLAAVGTTLSLLQQGDQLFCSVTGSSSSVYNTSVEVVTQALQDVKAVYGSQT